MNYAILINHTKEQQNTIHRLNTKFCVETIYTFPDKSIMSLTIQPPQYVIKFLKNRETCNNKKVFTGSIYTALTIYIMKQSSFALFKMLDDIPTTFLIKCSKHDSRKSFNPSQPSAAFHIETSHLIYTPNKVTGFYMKCNSRKK